MTDNKYRVVYLDPPEGDANAVCTSGFVMTPRGGLWYFDRPAGPPRTLDECRAACDTLDPDVNAPPRGRDSVRLARKALMAALRAEMRRAKMEEPAT